MVNATIAYKMKIEMVEINDWDPPSGCDATSGGITSDSLDKGIIDFTPKNAIE